MDTTLNVPIGIDADIVAKRVGAIEAAVYTHQSYDRPYGYWLRIPYASEWFDDPAQIQKRCIIGTAAGRIILLLHSNMSLAECQQFNLQLEGIKDVCQWLCYAKIAHTEKNDDLRIYIPARFRRHKTLTRHRTSLVRYKLPTCEDIFLHLRMAL